MRIHGGGEQTRDYTYVGDIVAGTLAAADRSGGPYNIATEKETSVNRLADMIGGPVEHVGLRDIDNVNRRFLSIAKATKELGWQPKVGLTEGLELTREWLSNGA
jgi:nucleoside-diphosphate-sugar epimerase